MVELSFSEQAKACFGTKEVVFWSRENTIMLPLREKVIPPSSCLISTLTLRLTPVTRKFTRLESNVSCSDIWVTIFIDPACVFLTTVLHLLLLHIFSCSVIIDRRERLIVGFHLRAGIETIKGNSYV